MRDKNSTPALKGLPEMAGFVAAILKELSNEKRLLILCALIENKGLSVAELAEMVDLGQSALSQHLARLREQAIIDFRRDGATIHYFIADEKIGRILKTLKSLYC